jgi:hypothetical protein
VWSNDTGLLTLGIWQGGFGSPPGGSCERWSITDTGIVASTGSLRWSGRPWTPEASWAGQLGAALQDTTLRRLTDQLRGVFTIVALSKAGNGAIASDPLGFSFVYSGDNADSSAVSSRAALCAWALVKERARPARDHLAACWPAYSRHWIGYRTGYEGVRLLPPGAVVKMEPRRLPSICVDRTPWMPRRDLRDLSSSELLDLAYEELADTVRNIVSLPGGSYRADLTGGKDTRLVASIALCEGLADQFTFETFGPPGLPDVSVATELARRFGLRHRRRFFEARSNAETFEERIRSFVATTGGMANLWYMRVRHGGWPEIRMSGTHGLLLRSKNRVNERATSEAEVIRGLDKMRFGAARILQPDVIRQLRQASVRELLDPAVNGSPVDRFDSFDLRSSQRHLLGVLGELESDVRITPLTSPRLVQIAYALGGSARISELIHVALTRRYSDELAAHPFAQEKWRRPPTDLKLETPTGESQKGFAVEGKAQLVERLQVSSFGERSRALLDVFNNPRNPAWDYVDRPAAIAALARFGDLAPWERIELFGAATAALWLGEDLGV